MKTGVSTKTLPINFRNELQRIIDSKNAVRANGRPASVKTQYERKLIICQAFGQLHEMGYRIKSPENLRAKHVEALVGRWDDEELVVNTLHTRVSVMNVFAGWIGKHGMVKSPVDYLGERAARTHIADEDLSWEAKGVDPLVVIAAAMQEDPRMALYLTLQYEFGLRVRESVLMRPAVAIKWAESLLEVFDGTKGSRLRVVPINTHEQRQALAWAQTMTHGRSGSICWPDRTWERAKDRFYILADRIGMTRAKLGVTAHGLRHSYAQKAYARCTGGKLPPIAGGNHKEITAEAHKDANLAVSAALGHVRDGVTASYYGSYGHALRPKHRSPWAYGLAEPTIVTYRGMTFEIPGKDWNTP